MVGQKRVEFVPEEHPPVNLGERIAGRPGVIDFAQEHGRDGATQRQLQSQEAPVAHSLFDSVAHRLVPELRPIP